MEKDTFFGFEAAVLELDVQEGQPGFNETNLMKITYRMQSCAACG